MATWALKFADGADQYTFTNVESLADNFGDMALATVRLPGLSGGFDIYGSEAAPSALGAVQVALMVDTSRVLMQTALDALRKLANLGLQKLYFQPEGEIAARWVYARIRSIQIKQESDNYLLLQPVQVSFEAADPFWQEDETATAMACSGTSSQVTVTNWGNATALARIAIACGTGQTAENPTVRRIVDGSTIDEMAYTGVLTASDTLVLNAQSKAVTLNGNDAYAGNPALHYDWFRLLPGDNTVRLVMTNAGDAATMTVYHHDTFR